MKTKLFAIVLAMLMLVQPVMAIGMVGVESAEEVTEQVQKKEVQEAETMAGEYPSNVLFYDDFDSRALGDVNTTPGEWVEVAPAYRKSGISAKLNNTAGIAYTDSGTGAEYKGNHEWEFVTDAEHGTVLKISQFNANNNDMGFDLNSVNFSSPGIYKFYFELKQELGSKDILGSNGNVLATAKATGVGETWSQTRLTDNNWASLEHPILSGDIAKERLGTWFPVVITYRVVDNGNGTITTSVTSTADPKNTPAGITTNAGVGVARVRNYFRFAPEKTAYGHLYLDDIKLTYDASYTVVKYVDEDGDTIYTDYAATSNAYELASKAELAVSFFPAYFVNGERVVGNTLDLTALGSEVTVTVKRGMPSHLPANTVIYEDFENRTIGANVSETAISYTTEEFDGSRIWNAYDGTKTAKYAYTPDDSSDVAMYVVSSDTYGNGVQIDLPDDPPVGRYTVVNRFWIDNDTKNADGSYFNTVSEWCRIWYAKASGDDDGFVGATPSIPFNKAENRKAWNEHSFTFEVYEENGTKYVKYGAETHELVGQNFYIKCHLACSNAGAENVRVYHDDVYIICEQAEEITATFVDENDESFDYVHSYSGFGGYKLPSADMMGIDYLVEFEGADGKTYYPGMTYALPDGVTEAKFVVKKTNVVLFEDYKGTDGSTVPTYIGGHVTENARLGAATVPSNASFDWKNRITGKTAYALYDFKLDTPGVYNFSADCELEVVSGTVPGKVEVAFQYPGYNTLKPRIQLTKENPKTTITGSVYIVKGADGQLYFYTSNNSTMRLVSNYALDDYHNAYGMKVGFDIAGYPDGTADADKEHYSLHFTNFKITFDEYAPVNTMKASYRESNANDKGGPEGIRFAAYVTDGQRELASEYGFVVTRKSLITTEGVTDYAKLNLEGIANVSTSTTSGKNSDGIAVVAAAAYNGTVDRIYVQDGKVFGLQGLYDTFYTAVLFGMTTDIHKSEVYVARPYAKIGGAYYYGECHEASYNSVKAAAEAANA